MIILPITVNAQTPIFQGAGLTECFKDGSCSIEQILDLANSVIRWLAAISGALALLMYIIGGIWMLFSSGNTSRVERGKNIIVGTSIALLFILSSWLLIDFTLRALRGEPGKQQLVAGPCQDREGQSCGGKGDNSVCFKGQCVTECFRLAQAASQDPLSVAVGDDKFACQNPSACGGLTYDDCASGDFSYCKVGLCPGGRDNVCCYFPFQVNP